MITPDMTYNLKEYQLYDLDFSQLRDYNLNTLDFVLREIRENMKNGTLRNLLEMRCASSPDTMTALRTLDRKYPSFTDKYLQLY
jgi:predicted RNA-binding protein